MQDTYGPKSRPQCPLSCCSPHASELCERSAAPVGEDHLPGCLSSLTPLASPPPAGQTPSADRRTGGSDATAARGHDAAGALAQAAEDRSAQGREDLTQTVAAITPTEGPPARPTACQPRACRHRDRVS